MLCLLVLFLAAVDILSVFIDIILLFIWFGIINYDLFAYNPINQQINVKSIPYFINGNSHIVYYLQLYNVMITKVLKYLFNPCWLFGNKPIDIMKYYYLY